MHINYPLIKQCYTVLQFKTVFGVCCFPPSFFSLFRLCEATSRCLSTTNFRTRLITMLHYEQNNMPSSTWNVPGGYFLPLLFAVMFTARCDRVFAFEEPLHVLTTNLSMIVFVSRCYERNYILQVTIELFLRWYLHWKYWGILQHLHRVHKQLWMAH